MEERCMTPGQITAFEAYLRQEERSDGTIQKYLHDVHAFVAWQGKASVTGEALIRWKQALITHGYCPVTVNSMLSALNSFFRFLQWPDCRVKFLKIQRRVFREKARELDRTEYQRLIETARAGGKDRLALVMETLGATGIRVSELQYVTVEALQSGSAEISLKGKIRTVFLPGKLCRKLQKYAKKQKIASGEIFLTKSGKRLSRQHIWMEMKRLCKRAGVVHSKVFPHNLRHLFATTFYQMYRDIARLADILGHSSIDTTRIYLINAGTDCIRQLNRLNLIT